MTPHALRARRPALLGIVLVLVICFSSCSASEADGQVVQVRPRAAVELVRGGEMVVLDVRPRAAFAAAHLRGARHLPYSAETYGEHLDSLDPAVDYLVYSRTGEKSAAACELMVAAGFEHVHDAGAFGALAIAGAPLVGAGG
jgi:rhodanese-related sulfurtransferase